MIDPIICFGQQPNGFFPKRFFYAKVKTALDLQKQIGGKIVFFYHDSDADYRETITILKDKQTGKEAHLNFKFRSKLQKKHSPLYAKRVAVGWQEEMLRLLPQYISKENIKIFQSSSGKTVADFCLDVYSKLGLTDGLAIVKSSDPSFRSAAQEPKDYFADLVYEKEIVRARFWDGKFLLHEGGGKNTEVKASKVKPEQISAARDSRFAWMQSVINCTHYIYGEGEKAYLDTTQFPNITFVDRNNIENSHLAWLGK
jgi:hypothetical protein